MALKIKKVEKAKVSAMDLLARFQSDMGEGSGSLGNLVTNADRVPTGLFELDLSLGGGFPRGKVSTIFGPESSNKTNIALRAIAMHQKLWPNLKCVFVDIENEYNGEWASSLGVDTKKLILLKPAYAEQAVDMVEAMLHADDCGLVVMDSLAALCGTAELEKSAEGAIVGGVSTIIGKLYRKTIAAFVEAEKHGRLPTLFYINQITYKVGVMFGNPEGRPGGKKPDYQSAIILRAYGKNVIDAKVSKVMPVRKDVSFVIQKFKVPILAINGKFEMATLEHGDLQVGQCDDASSVKSYLEAMGKFEKAPKGGWLIFGEEYPTQKDWKAKLYSDPVYGNQVRAWIIDNLLKKGDFIEGEVAS